MSDAVKHECGIVLFRLRKPLEYYRFKYGSWQYGLRKVYLLMEKQHNRGQDGAGLVNVKIDQEPGKQYIFRQRSNKSNPIYLIFKKIYDNIEGLISRANPSVAEDPGWARENLPFAGELFLGHLRYGTFGLNSIDAVHPVLRLNNWRSRNLALAGNFNLTNVDELFRILIGTGQHPREYSDTVTILENIGYYLDEENQDMYHRYLDQGVPREQISSLIEENIDLSAVLRQASKRWDGGYAIGGIVGHGDAFVFRDPWGIRPVYYYHDEEVVVATSERPVIQTVLNVRSEDVYELTPGSALIVRKTGRVETVSIRDTGIKRSCSFERIYFSRGGDADIYRERKKLGELLTSPVLKVIDHDLQHTVFSYIPNTSESAFYGLIKGLQEYLLQWQQRQIMMLGANPDEDQLKNILAFRPRIEKVAIKDVKLRTFIAQEKGRNDLVEHVYDITYGTVEEERDTLVIMDDSIVRGTTLKRSILKILDRLRPKKIVVVSSSPQIRYPDCYGIDMSRLDQFIAFQAAIALLRERGMEAVINEVYLKCKEQEAFPKEKIVNHVKKIYDPFTPEEISRKIAELLRDESIRAEVVIVYQTIENLHEACPGHTGDWYFTGDYPTPGGNKVVSTAFIHYMEGKQQRAY
ncbi:MAG: amidophosphoribosyltransferase [Bacteroidales bacterium]